MLLGKDSKKAVRLTQLTGVKMFTGFLAKQAELLANGWKVSAAPCSDSCLLLVSAEDL